MQHLHALAGTSGDMGARAMRGARIEAGAAVRGRWNVVAHAGKGWRGVLTRVRRALYRIANGYTGDEGAYLRRLGDWIAWPARKWTDDIQNIVVNAGLNYLLDAGLSGGAQITTWYLLLTDGTPTVAAGDTMSSHAGWAEVTAYDESTRAAWTDGGVSSQSVTNSASAAVFTISADSTTVGGAGLTSVSTKGGTTGTLYAAGAFSAGDKGLDDGDTLTVTAAFDAAAT